MHFYKRNTLPGMLVAFLAVLMMTAGVAQAATPSWQIVSSPNVSSTNDQLTAVAAVSANDVWAVGNAPPQGPASPKPSHSSVPRSLQKYVPAVLSSGFAEQWNGTSWNIVPTANPKHNNGTGLNGLAVIPGTSNLWAVGDYMNAKTSFYDTLIEQWNDASMSWSVIPSPNYQSKTNYNFLTGVVALSATNAWAVGFTENTTSFTVQTLIEHWNGKAWNIVRSTGPSTIFNALTGVAAVSSTDIWTVGFYQDANGYDETLTEHYQKNFWAVVSSPNVQTDINYNYLGSVALIPGTNNVLAVGYNMPEQCPCTEQTLIEQWNGSSWSILPSANSSSLPNNILNSVTALSSTSAWAVGSSTDSNYSNAQTLIEQWDGVNWTVVSSPNVPSQENYLYSVTGVPNSTNLWSVGETLDSNSNLYTLTEYYG